jgi:hypothetical protein
VKRNNILDKEEKYAKKLLKKYPFLKKMWEEREKVFNEAHRREDLIEKKYNKIAQKAGLKSVKFAYNEYCFGIDVNDVDAHGTNLKENRLLVHDSTLEEDT